MDARAKLSERTQSGTDFGYWSGARNTPFPGDLLKAYYEADLSKDNKSGLASAEQKREAKASAHDRHKVAARDGRFRRKCPGVPDRPGA